MQLQSRSSRSDGSHQPHACPYLGLDLDPSTHTAFVARNHICGRVRGTNYLSAQHQEKYCLTPVFGTCPVYLAIKPHRLPPTARGEIQPDNIWLKRLATGYTGRFANWVRTWVLEPILSQPLSVRLTTVAVFVFVVLLGIIIVSRRTALMAQLLPADTSSSTPVVASLEDIAQPSGQSTAQSTAENPSIASITTSTPVGIAPTVDVHPTATLTLFPLATPTSIPDQNSQAQQPFALTASGEVDCSQANNYRFEIISGPVLSPTPTYVFQTNSGLPSPQAAWIVKNTSPCEWQLLQLTNANGFTIKPYTRRDGEPYDLSDSGNRLSRQQEIEIILGFDPARARNVSGVWTLEVNGLSLEAAPRLTLDIQEWIIELK